MTISDRESGPDVVVDRKGARQAKISNVCSVFSASYAKVPRLQQFFQKMSIMIKYNVYLSVQSEVAESCEKNNVHTI